MEDKLVGTETHGGLFASRSLQVAGQHLLIEVTGPPWHVTVYAYQGAYLHPERVHEQVYEYGELHTQLEQRAALEQGFALAQHWIERELADRSAQSGGDRQ
jgi:hypothetical protein